MRAPALSVPRPTRAARRRPERPRHVARARALVLAHGWNSTSHQVLDPGMSHWFSAAGDAVVGYASAAGMRVVAGAPVASDARLVAVAAEFEDATRAAGGHVCYFAAEERLLRLAAGRGYTRHLIGLQPVWSPSSWAQRFDGTASLRAQRNRAANKGVRVTEAPAARALDPDLRSCHDAWLDSKGLPRLGFVAHSRLGACALVDRRLYLAELAGTVLGYLSLAPVPLRRGWLVESIVRHPDAPNGTVELLLDTALRHLASDCERFTLGLAPLAGPSFSAAGDGRPPAWLALLERLAVARGARLYDFAGLYAFKSKFQPEAWEPVYLLSTRERIDIRTLLALAGAFLAPEDRASLAA